MLRIWEHQCHHFFKFEELGSQVIPNCAKWIQLDDSNPNLRKLTGCVLGIPFFPRIYREGSEMTPNCLRLKMWGHQ